jgi:hypothetical protein
LVVRERSSWAAGRIVAVLTAATLGGGLGASHSYRTDTTVLLEMQVKSSVPSIAQVFFDIGRGFNEKDSQALSVAGTDVFQTLDFPLPHEPIRQLRFDPLTGPGTLVIRRMAVWDGAHRLIASFRPERLIPANETRVQPLAEGALIETVPNARDPITIVPLNRPIASTINARTSAVWWGLAWLAAVFCVALILTSRPVSAWWSTTARHCVGFLSADPAAPDAPLSRHRRSIPFVFLSLIAAAHIIRAPRLFVDPRFWAEEGTVWFQHAVIYSPLSTLLFIFHESGYFNLFANLSAVLASVWASLFGLEFAPIVTTICALFAQLLCFVFILWGRSRLTDAWWKRILACFIVLLSPVAVGEIWLNSINSMSYLGLIALLLLFQDPDGWTAWKRWGVRGLLIVCGLTGVYSAVLFPLFVLAFLLYRTREHLYQAAILGLCFTTQVGSMLLVRAGSGLNLSRFSRVSLDSALVNVFFNHVATPCLGAPGARLLFHWFGMDDALVAAAAVPRGGGLVLAGWFSFLVIALVFVFVCRRLTWVEALLVSCFVLYAVLTAVASLNGIPHSRYAYLPGTIMLLLLLVAVASAPARWVRIACGATLTISLTYGMAMYRRDPSFSAEQWGAPSWSREVAEWRHNPHHPLRVWPSWWAASIHYPPEQPRLSR